MGLVNIKEESVQVGRLVGDEEVVQVDRLEDRDPLVGEADIVHLGAHQVLGLGKEVGGLCAARVGRPH